MLHPVLAWSDSLLARTIVSHGGFLQAAGPVVVLYHSIHFLVDQVKRMEKGILEHSINILLEHIPARVRRPRGGNWMRCGPLRSFFSPVVEESELNQAGDGDLIGFKTFQIQTVKVEFAPRSMCVMNDEKWNCKMAAKSLSCDVTRK